MKRPDGRRTRFDPDSPIALQAFVERVRHALGLGYLYRWCFVQGRLSDSARFADFGRPGELPSSPLKPVAGRVPRVAR